MNTYSPLHFEDVEYNGVYYDRAGHLCLVVDKYEGHLQLLYDSGPFKDKYVVVEHHPTLLTSAYN